MYSSRHNHALRRSREGSGRFVGGPVYSSDETGETASITPSSLTPYHSDTNHTTITTSVPTDSYLPFNNQLETAQQPHEASSEGNTNNNNHNATVDLFKSSSAGEEVSVDDSEQRGTVITASIAVS